MTFLTPKNKPNVRNQIWTSWIVIIIFFGGFALWAFLASIDSAAVAPGKIEVSGSHRLIQHYEGGIVKKIYVENGDKVKKGQLLIALDKTQASSQDTLFDLQIDQALATITRIKAELSEKESLVFPAALLQQQSHSNVKTLLKNQQQLFKANRLAFINLIKIHEQQIQQLNEQINAIMAQRVANTEQLRLINKELQDMRVLAKERLVKQSQLLALEREAARLSGDLGKHKAEIAALKQKISESKVQIITIKQKHRQTLLQELRDNEHTFNELQEKRSTSRDVLQRTDITAPAAGTVVDLQVHTVGGVIKPGETLMEIVPSNKALVINARVNPLDIDVVKPGLTAKVRISALKQRTTPLLLGKVTHVSASTYQDELTGQNYYRATIEIDKEELKKIKQQVLQPGMPVEVMIITDQLTPWQYFTDPITKSFSTAFLEQ